ncbi:hypothetical protein ASD11_05650 [Aeromicrobium sp. Root495]|uniref:hypothetical protein n=1 Tax=Aeromicrobium sp. Root495 TaxID=1736550 RepID=UPI0006FE57DD|nr:hypothetical protein [Aeromicrobium sp. Root495]KQY59086.1 hypothetical protein ASD11_05650 [Aeromicrobium sp. Root495]
MTTTWNDPDGPRFRRLVDETLGGPPRAADVLGAGVVLVHLLTVAGILALSWFDGSDLRLLLDVRSSPAPDVGTLARGGPLVWVVAQLGSFPWWAAAVLLLLLTALVDLAAWWAVRSLAGRRLRTPLALVALGFPGLTIAATDLSTGVVTLPLTALLVVGLTCAELFRRHERRRDVVLAASTLALAVVLAVALVSTSGALTSTAGRSAPAVALGLVGAAALLPRLRPRPAVLATGVLAVACVASTITLAALLAREDATRDYVRGVEDLARSTGTVTLAATDVPPNVLPRRLGSTSVAELFARSDEVVVRRAGNDLRMADGLGFVRQPRVAGGVGTVPPAPGSCGQLLRGSGSSRAVTVARLSAPRRTPDAWVSISYLASQDDTVELGLDGTTLQVDVLRGAHTYLLRVGSRTPSEVTLRVGTRGSSVCVGVVGLGPLVPTELA